MYSSMWTVCGSVRGLLSVLSDTTLKLKFILKYVRYFQPITWSEGTEWE